MESRVPDFDAPYYLVNYNNNMDKHEELKSIERLSKYAGLLWKVIQEFLPDNHIACKGHGEKHLNEVLCRALKYRTNKSITDYIKNNFKLCNVDYGSFDYECLNNRYKDDMEMNFYVLITAAFTHDLYTNINRRYHHTYAKVFVNKTLYQVLVNDYHKTNPMPIKIISESIIGIKKMLNRDQLHWILGEASFCVAEHRASSSVNPSTLLSYIFTVADRDVMNVENIYNRTLSISKEQVRNGSFNTVAADLSLKSLRLYNEGKITINDVKSIAKALHTEDMGFDDLNEMVGAIDFKTVLILLRTKLHLIDKFSKGGYIFENDKGKLYLFVMKEVYPELYKSYFSKLKKLTKMEFNKDYSEA